MKAAKSPPKEQSDIVRPKEAVARLNVAPTTLRNWEKKGLFPKRLQLGPKAVGWRRPEFEAWLASRINK